MPRLCNIHPLSLSSAVNFDSVRTQTSLHSRAQQERSTVIHDQHDPKHDHKHVRRLMIMYVCIRNDALLLLLCMYVYPMTVIVPALCKNAIIAQSISNSNPYVLYRSAQEKLARRPYRNQYSCCTTTTRRNPHPTPLTSSPSQHSSLAPTPPKSPPAPHPPPHPPSPDCSFPTCPNRANCSS